MEPNTMRGDRSEHATAFKPECATILVVGGHGAVGSTVVKELASGSHRTVLVGGRNGRRNVGAAPGCGSRIMPIRFDVEAADTYDAALQGVDLVVVCVEQSSVEFVRACIERGIDYVDISATYEFLLAVELLDGVASTHGATVVLSVGLSPGITNILATTCAKAHGRARHIDIFLMLGLGEKHGEGAVRWIVERLGRRFYVIENGVRRSVPNFGDGKRTFFPGKLGQRTAYRFDLADQHVLGRRPGITSVATRICFDSRLMTAALAILRKVGVLKLFGLHPVSELAVRLFRKLQFGCDTVAVKVRAYENDADRNAEELCVIGRRESTITGIVAAVVAGRLVEGGYPSGVYHIEQLFEPAEILEPVSRHGVRLVGSL